MIGRIRGTLLEKNPPSVLVDVGGIGYELDVPMSTFYDLPAAGGPVSLHVHLIVREDAHLLFGFGSTRERALFRALLKVSGVGARVALAILSGMNVDDFGHCILGEDATALTRIPGIGRKTADRLVLEMKDKLPDDLALPGGDQPEKSTARSAVASSARHQALDALIALGYKPAEATKLIEQNSVSDDAPVEDIIRAALKSINVH